MCRIVESDFTLQGLDRVDPSKGGRNPNEGVLLEANLHEKERQEALKSLTRTSPDLVVGSWLSLFTEG